MAAGQGFKTFTTGEVLTAADVNGYLMQGVNVFASATERDAEITSPQEGQFAYLKDTNVTTYYTGSAWANLDTTGMTNPMTTTGDTIYSSSGSTPARLGIGSTGQVLTVSGGIPSWATPASGGGMTLISDTVANNVSSITLGSIPQTHKQLILIWSGIYGDGAAGSTSWSARFNNNSGNIYALQNGDINGSSATANLNLQTSLRSATVTSFGIDVQNSGAYEQSVNGRLVIDNYASTSYAKALEYSYSYRNASGTSNTLTGVGIFNDTTAITSIDIVRLTGSKTLYNLSNTSIRLYGVS